MSLEGLRGLLAEQALRSERSNTQQSQSNQILRQGSGVQGSQVTLSVNAQSVFGARSLTNAFNQNLSVANIRPNFSNPESSGERPLFDFEEVAQNVLRFVGGVITRARDSGVDSTELESLFEQARTGIANGIASAEQDLGDLINDDIAQGIESSRNRIEEGLQSLERNIFNPSQPNDENGLTTVSASQTVQAVSENSGDLRIRTRDGDEISLSFSSLQAIQRDQSLIIEQARQVSQSQGEAQVQSPQTPQSDAQNVAVNDEQSDSAADNGIVTTAQDNEVNQGVNTGQVDDIETTSPNSSTQVQISELRFQQEAFNLSITGELDEQELVAIGDLLRDVTSLADEFFNGDVETAFNQALELGFNDEELIGFALELNQVQQVQVVQTYESVSQFTDSQGPENEDRVESRRANVNAISQYLERLQRVFDDEALVGPPSIDEFVSSILERAFGNDVLNESLNRFNQFNQRLLSNLPTP